VAPEGHTGNVENRCAIQTSAGWVARPVTRTQGQPGKLSLDGRMSAQAAL